MALIFIIMSPAAAANMLKHLSQFSYILKNLLFLCISPACVILCKAEGIFLACLLKKSILFNLSGCLFLTFWTHWLISTNSK